MNIQTVLVQQDANYFIMHQASVLIRTDNHKNKLRLQLKGTTSSGGAFVIQLVGNTVSENNLPVIAILADHLDVPSRTLCLTAFMCPE